jgi:hypothetical protein
MQRRKSQFSIILLASVAAYGGSVDSAPVSQAPNASAVTTSTQGGVPRVVQTPVSLPSSIFISSPLTANAPTQSQAPIPSNGSINFAAPLRSTGYRANGNELSQTILDRLSGSIAKFSEASKAIEAATYRVSGNQTFRAFATYTKNSPDLMLFGVTDVIGPIQTPVTVVANFRLVTAAGIFPCTFGPSPSNAADKECGLNGIRLEARGGSTNAA